MMTPKISRRSLLLGSVAFLAASRSAAAGRFADSPWRKLTDEEWRARLKPDAYAVLRQAATERAGTSPLDKEHRKGVFSCAGCGLALFKSEWKFNSGTGWPSFYRAIDESIVRQLDLSQGMTRIEYHCARCLGHQGHRFDDGPAPTGLRYCNNGVALSFTPS